MRKEIWEIAIGLNKVDNLVPSDYLRELINKNLSCDEMEKEILKYYEFRDLTLKTEKNLKECDLVSIRVVKLLENSDFKFSIEYLKEIHKNLFSGILKESYVGVFRNYNISKNERILNGKSVIYGDYREIIEYLNYDFERENKTDYKALSSDEKIKKLSKFISSIWQVHPFIEGNTRTTAIFLIKYLKSLGVEINENIFIENSPYFRNALVLSNYSDRELKISNDYRFLVSFFTKLIVDYDEKLPLIESPEVNQKRMYICDYFYRVIDKVAQLQIYLNSEKVNISSNREMLEQFVCIEELDDFVALLGELNLPRYEDIKLFVRAIKENHRVMLRQSECAKVMELMIHNKSRIKGVFFPNYVTRELELIFPEDYKFSRKVDLIRKLIEYFPS